MVRRFTLLVSFVCFFVSINAQTNDLLKDFINKNNVAIRSVQKNALANGVSTFDSEYKELIKKQVVAVKTYSADKILSSSAAMSVRLACLDFLKKYAPGSTEYFEISAEEKKISASKFNMSFEALSSDEIKKINALNINDVHGLNSLALTIQ